MNTYIRLTTYEPECKSPRWGSDCIEVVKSSVCPVGFRECPEAGLEFHIGAHFPALLFPDDQGFARLLGNVL